ncbi:MAG: uncharacterized protein KVP18_003378 [Porospora cf. gigantea A]|uniref:uncharacterized protein n=1 Tax=Porospora cf. gigantea A TaxID=2853593 RepID=UPI00355A0871|nr:MAG: hypothetical protein KVP18_003378 [Porospora cf. gigantea A]
MGAFVISLVGIHSDVHHLREQQLERLTQSLDVAQHALDKHVRKSALLQQNNEKLQSQLDSCQNALAAENREKKELQRQVKSLQTAAQYHEWMHRKAQKDLVHKVNENDRAALSTLISTGELTLDFLVSLRSETQSLVDLIVQCFTPNTSSDK